MNRRARSAGVWVLLLIGMQSLVLADAVTDPNAVIDVGDRKQLFIDGLFFESSDNIAQRVVPALKTGEHTLVSDRPWENATLNWFSVMDDAGTYRMWYECYDVEGWPTTDDTSFCYAESLDGIHWNKPSLGLFAYHGATDNNILFRQIGTKETLSRVHGAGVFKDLDALPEARYKAVSQGIFAGFDPPHRVAGMFSPDGLHWTRLPHPICDVFADSQYSAFWDEAIGQYVLFGRVAGRGRAIGRAVSPTFDRFEALTLVLQTDDRDPSDSDLYNPAASKYAYADGIYLMFPSVYRHTEDTLDIHLAVSRDGIHWSWPDHGRPFVALGATGAFDSGSLYMAQEIVRSGNELWMYYGGSPLTHNEAELDALAIPENRRVYSRVVCRLDGFVSVEAGDMEGGFITPPLAFQGTTLHLNAKTDAAGEIRVGLLDGENRPLVGYSVEDCIPIRGDHIDTTVTWNDGGKRINTVDKPVKLTVRMKNASLFAFQFAP